MHYSELIDAFHLRLGRLTDASGLLDFNVGLALSWLGQLNNIDVSKLLDPKKTQMGQRLTELEKLVLKTHDPSQPQVAADFKAWFRRAESARALRNDYVHARWGFPGELKEEEPYVFFLALHWNTDPGQADQTVKLPLSEFDQQIDEIATLASEFRRLSDQHSIHSAPIAWWMQRKESTSDTK